MSDEDIKIPKGWRKVTSGPPQEGDRVWVRNLLRFFPVAANEPHVDAGDFRCLIRRLPPYKTDIWKDFAGWQVAVMDQEVMLAQVHDLPTKAEAKRIRDALLVLLADVPVRSKKTGPVRARGK